MNVKRKILFSFFVFGILTGYAQQPLPEVAFLKQAPVIDGKPDYSLQLKRQRFQVMEKSDSVNGDTKAEYSMAYGPDFLYIIITYQADAIMTREKAFQNGDGVTVMIGTSVPDSAPSHDYFVFGFSNSYDWDRKVLWFASGEMVLKPLNDEIKMECDRLGDHISFEILIPWKQVYPFNPYFTQRKLGINISLVQAIGNIQKNKVSLVKDDLFQTKNTPRLYVVPSFAPPEALDYPMFYLSMQQNTLTSRDRVIMALTSLYKTREFFLLRTSVISGENTTSFLQSDTFSTGPDKSVFYFSTRSNFTNGGYKLLIEVLRDGIVVYQDDRYFSVLSDLNPDEMKARLQRLKPRLVPGTYNTLMFYTLDYMDQLNKIRPYQTAYEARLSANKLSYIMEKLMDGNDMVATQMGIMRRAYFSPADSSFQPYSIYVPRYYELGKRYPVIFFLHSDGEDDRDITNFLATVTRDFIVVAPTGRGENHCFATPEALIDFQAVMNDVKKNYFLDTNNIFLAGFSMGGYGVYRVFYEYPGLFKALVVLSGHPNLANKWLGKGYPDFTDPKNLKPFKGKDVFIFQGSKDADCPPSLVETTVSELKKAGANITFITEDTGHLPMNASSRDKFRSWIKNLTGI